jgi:hypothetical protein
MKMLDHVDSRMWADHGHDFSAFVASALSKAFAAFQRLNAIQFDAPWQHEGRRPKSSGEA